MVAAAVVGAGTVGGLIAVPHATDEAHAAYITPWSRGDAYSIAATGLGEAYEYGWSKWYDNNYWDTNEGADCSGYAGKVWQNSSAFNPIDVNKWYVTTLSWYTGGVDSAYAISLWDFRSIIMDTFVYHSSYGGPGDHMGVFEGSYDSNYGFKTWEGRSESEGINWTYRSLDVLNGQGAKRFKRVNW